MATITIDWDLGFPFQVQEVVLEDTSNTIVFDDPQESAAPLILRLEQGSGIGAKLANWPNNVFWAAGVPPTLSVSAGEVDVLDFVAVNTVASGFQYYGRVFGIGVL